MILKPKRDESEVFTSATSPMAAAATVLFTFY